MALVAINKDVPIFKPTFEYQETTMQVPFGEHSFLFALLFKKTLKPVETMVLLYANYHSNYDTGKTHWITSRKLAEVFKLSLSYIRQRLRAIRAWMRTLKTSVEGKIYQLTHYLCDDGDVPTDTLGNPLKFSVPRGKGGPIERLKTGDISWNACLIWIVLKFFSKWKTGETNQMNMTTLANHVGMSKNTVCTAIKELQAAGMLKRLSKPWATSRFQLYPKPPEKSEAQRMTEKPQRKKRTTLKIGEYDVHLTEQHAYSENWQWRISFGDGSYEKRNGQQWKLVSDSERHKIPKAVVRDLDQALAARREISQTLGSFDSDTSGFNSNISGFDSDTPMDEKGYKPA